MGASPMKLGLKIKVIMKKKALEETSEVTKCGERQTPQNQSKQIINNKQNNIKEESNSYLL